MKHLKHRITRKGRRATTRWVELSYYGGKKKLESTGMCVWMLSPEEVSMVRRIPGTTVVRIEGPDVWPVSHKLPPEPKKKAKEEPKKKAKKK